jgi:hypothetical protein
MGPGAAGQPPYLLEEDRMRKKLALLVFALAAVAATSTSHAASSTCPKNTRPIDCGTYILCCPFNAFCVCGNF